MNKLRTTSRILLAAFLLFAGVGHLTFARITFLAQVPPWLPLSGDLVVVASGVVEIALGTGLLDNWRGKRLFGLATALFFLAVFPGNIAQFLEHRSAFGLTTDMARGVRLLFQPALILWALWSTTEAGERWYRLNLKRPRQESNLRPRD